VNAPISDETESGTRERRGLFALLADIPRLLRELIEAEIESMKNEIVGKMKAAGIGAGFLVGAGVLAFFAVLVLTAAGILALALVLPAWAAALIVAAALLALAGLAVAIGVYQLKRGVPPTPTETIESVKRDVRVVRGLRKRGAS
jgi:hypothetical protein